MAEPLTDHEIADERTYHKAVSTLDSMVAKCDCCLDEDWPCLTQRLLDTMADLQRQLQQAQEELEAQRALAERRKLALSESALMLRAAANEAQRLRQDGDAKALREAAEFAHRMSILTPAEALRAEHRSPQSGQGEGS